MKLALVLGLLIYGAPQEALTPTLRGEARVESPASAVEVGEPFALELTLRHAAGDAPRIDDDALEADPTWAVLSSSAAATLSDPRSAQTAVTRASWQIVSLEPGERELPAPAIVWGAGKTAEESIEVSRGRLAVRAVLAADEDAPRPIGEFLGLKAEVESGARLAWGIGAVALLVLAGVAWLLVARRRRRAAPASAGPTPLERLKALEEAQLEQPEAVVAAHVELARALRESIDGALGTSVPGLTDREWAAGLAPRLGTDAAQACEQLLAACEPVKYGAERPTHWAARERIARARELAAAAARSPAEARA